MIYKNKKNKNLILEIEQEINGESPRNWDNLGIIMARHRDYKLEDKEIPSSFDGTFDELGIYIAKELDGINLIPLSLYDHSGISIGVSGSYPYNDMWDSSLIGYIYTTKEKIKEFFGVKKITKEILKKVNEILLNEIKTYNEFLIGDVYYYRLIELETCNLGHTHKKVLDYCGGFYGTDFKENGLFDNIDCEYKFSDWEFFED